MGMRLLYPANGIWADEKSWCAPADQTRLFDKSWILVEGSSDHFAAIPAIAELPDVNYRENGKPVELPQDFFSSKTFTDKMIGFIEQNKTSDKPFFGYLAFTAPHYPLQAPEDYIEKYRGAYDQGYEAIRTRRIEDMKRRGIIAEDLKPRPASALAELE